MEYLQDQHTGETPRTQRNDEHLQFALFSFLPSKTGPCMPEVGLLLLPVPTHSRPLLAFRLCRRVVSRSDTVSTRCRWIPSARLRRRLCLPIPCRLSVVRHKTVRSLCTPMHRLVSRSTDGHHVVNSRIVLVILSSNDLILFSNGRFG